MALSDNISVNPLSGTGNGSVTIMNNDTYYGRLDRTSTMKLRTQTKEKTITVIEKASADYMELLDPFEPAFDVVPTGGQYDVTISMNGTGIKIQPDIPSDVTISQLGYRKNGGAFIPITNNVVIPGDPGATGEYIITLTLTFQNYTSVMDNSYNIVVSSLSRPATQIVFSVYRQPMEEILTVDKETITIGQGGSIETLNITSNTNWDFDI